MGVTKLVAKEWLKDVGFDDATIEQIADKFTPAQMAKIAEGTMRQSEFDRVMNEGKAEIAKSQRELAEANDKLNRELAEWATVQAQGGTATKAMQDALDKAQADVLKLTQKLTRVATDAGLDPQKILTEVQVTTEPPKAPPAPDLTGYAKSDDVSRSIGQLAEMSLTLPAELQQLAYEHQQLFGTALDTRTIVAEIKARAGTRGNTKPLDPRAIWEEAHKVADKRTEVEKARVDRLIADAEERGRQKGMSETTVPGGHTPTGRHSPVMGAERKSALERPQPGQTINAAVSAFRSGKYRQGAQKTV